MNERLMQSSVCKNLEFPSIYKDSQAHEFSGPEVPGSTLPTHPQSWSWYPVSLTHPADSSCSFLGSFLSEVSRLF